MKKTVFYIILSSALLAVGALAQPQIYAAQGGRACTYSIEISPSSVRVNESFTIRGTDNTAVGASCTLNHTISLGSIGENLTLTVTPANAGMGPGGYSVKCVCARNPNYYQEAGVTVVESSPSPPTSLPPCSDRNDADHDGFGCDDACPNNSGSVSGCPPGTQSGDDENGSDTGSDPNPPPGGDGSNGGVSSSTPDQDGDGVPDPLDACPTVPVTTYGVDGCPDQDGDGVRDLDDACPNVPGPAGNSGCPPDRDGDRVADSEDACPYVRGADGAGCPIQPPSDGVCSAVVNTAETRNITEGVNIRSGPSEQDQIVGSLSPTDIATVVGETINPQGERWYRVEFNGQNGWVLADLIRIGGLGYPCQSSGQPLDIAAALTLHGCPYHIEAARRLPEQTQQMVAASSNPCGEIDRILADIDHPSTGPDLPPDLLARMVNCPYDIPAFVAALEQLGEQFGQTMVEQIVATLTAPDICLDVRRIIAGQLPPDVPSNEPAGSTTATNAAIRLCQPGLPDERIAHIVSQFQRLSVAPGSLGNDLCVFTDSVNLLGSLSDQQVSLYHWLTGCYTPLESLRVVVYAAMTGADASLNLNGDVCRPGIDPNTILGTPQDTLDISPELQAQLEGCSVPVVRLFLTNHRSRLTDAELQRLMNAPDRCLAIVAYMQTGYIPPATSSVATTELFWGTPGSSSAGPTNLTAPPLTPDLVEHITDTAYFAESFTPYYGLLSSAERYRTAAAVFVESATGSRPQIYLLANGELTPLDDSFMPPGNQFAPALCRAPNRDLQVIYLLEENGRISLQDTNLTARMSYRLLDARDLSSRNLAVDTGYRLASGAGCTNVLITLRDLGTNNLNIYIVRQLNTPEPLIYNGFNPAYSYENRLIVFERGEAPQRSIILAGSDGTEISPPLTDPAEYGDCFAPAFAPDSLDIFFLCEKDGIRRLYVYDGVNISNITPTGVSVNHPSPGPVPGYLAFDDGSTIYWSLDDGSNFGPLIRLAGGVSQLLWAANAPPTGE